jgi:hypothetical protein
MAGRREAVRALTAVDALGGTEHIVLTRHEGRSWAGVTPAGLTNQTGARRITSLFVLDADHAWTTYGGITDAAAQTVDSTGDARLQLRRVMFTMTRRHAGQPMWAPTCPCKIGSASRSTSWYWSSDQ